MLFTSVAGIAIEKGRVFAARRLPEGDLGGKWEFPGGKVEEGESCEEALVREFEEELGCVVKVGALLGEASFLHKGKDFALYGYEVSLPPGGFILKAHEEYRWVSAEEIEALDFAPSDMKLLPFIKERFAR